MRDARRSRPKHDLRRYAAARDRCPGGPPPGGRPAMRTIITLAATLTLLAAAPARAEDLHSGNGIVAYDDTGEASPNNLTVSVDAGDFRFVDSALIAASGDCSSSGLFVARCPVAGIIGIEVGLAGEDDRLNAAGIDVPVVVLGGAGSDALTGGAAGDGLSGSVGDDEIHGGPGPDIFDDAVQGHPGGGADDFYGDAGDDIFLGAGPDDAGSGVDRYDGGDGLDTILYKAHGAGSVVNLASGTSQLAGADGDTLVSIEHVFAGAGADLLIGNGADNLLVGGASGDVLFGGEGTDQLEGQPGADTLDGGPGPDVLRGGTDADTVSYASSPGPVLVTLDGQPGDGRDGENDDVGSDIENVRATPFADEISGNAGANVVRAGSDADAVDGAEGDDELHGEAGADRLVGGPGRDTIAGGAGGDDVDAGTGDDTIDVADGEQDKVTCGIGIDTVSADQADVLFGDCEVVARAGQTAAPPAAPSPTAAAPPQPVVALEGRRVRVSSTGRARIRMRCAGVACTGTLVLKHRRRTIARTRYALVAGSRAPVTFRLTRTGRRLLRRTGRLNVAVTAGGITRRYTLVRRART
jgi:Ca2+-binding RTX toxin-like protein